MPLSCRYYEDKFPDVEDTVVANVISIQEMGAYVRLLIHMMCRIVYRERN